MTSGARLNRSNARLRNGSTNLRRWSADADADQGVCWYDGESDAAVAVGEGVVDEIDDRLFKVERIDMNKDVGAFDLDLTPF